MDNTKKLKTLSLCTGYSGIERGLELAGESLRTLAHVEIEAYAIANLVAKMEEGKMDPAPIWTNVKTLPVEPFRGVVDLLTGGYPCQPFSTAGKRLGAEDPRHLLPHILRIIDEVMPRMCFFENVEGHISLGLREVLEDLESRGYKTTWGIFGTKELGFVHERKRVFILAHSKDERLQRREDENGIQERVQELQGVKQSVVWGKVEGCVRDATTEGFDRKPLLDRRVDGATNRTDRLRLLGNGVVPQTAAKAWITLNGELQK